MKIKQLTFCVLLGLSAHQTANASSEGVYDYVVGGGNPIMGTTSTGGFNPEAGVGWEGNLSCSDFSIDHSLTKGFDSGQIKRMQSQVIGLLKDTFNPVGLIGTAIRRADPGLYETIMNGTEAIKLDFDIGVNNCEEAQAAVMDVVMGGDGRAVARSERWSMHASTAKKGANFDIITESNLKNIGDEGVKIGNESKGGVGQPPIEAIRETVKHGFKSLTSGSGGSGGGGGILGGAGSLSLSLMGAQALNGSNQEPVKVFESAEAAQKFVHEVVGENMIRTCEGCPPSESIPGRGVKKLLDDERQKMYEALVETMGRNIATLKNADLKHLSAHDTVIVNKEVIIALRKMPAKIREGYIRSLASDIALARISNQLIFARQAMSMGRNAAELTSIESIQKSANYAVALLDDELNSLEREIRVKRFMARNTAIAILEREEALKQSLVIDTKKEM